LFRQDLYKSLWSIRIRHYPDSLNYKTILDQ
jgi:hypothetical protein